MASQVKILSSIILLNLSIIFAGESSSYLSEKPSYMISCLINDPDFVKCSTRSVQRLMNVIIKNDGLPGLPSLPPIDPLHINKIKIDQQGASAVNLNVELANVEIGGFKQLTVIESKVSPKDYHWETRFYLPKMTLRGNYHLKGRILLITLNGHGNMSMTLDHLKIDLYTTARLYEKGNYTFCNVTDARASYKIDMLNVQFDNLFNGNKLLEDSTNEFFNENWKTLNDAMSPVIQAAISEILLQYMGTIFHFLPANFFVTDIPTSKELYGDQATVEIIK